MLLTATTIFNKADTTDCPFTGQSFFDKIICKTCLLIAVFS